MHRNGHVSWCACTVPSARPASLCSANDSTRNDGLLSRLMFWRSGRTDAKPEQYRVLVRDNKDTSQVHVLNRDGAADRSDTARRILALLHQQLK